MSGTFERWLPVVGLEGRYDVSDQGRVRLKSRRLLRGCAAPRQRGAYWQVCLSRDGWSRSFLVHQLVLEAFVGSRPEGMECRHLDGNGGNNVLTNLAWGTAQENANDRASHGTQVRGELVGNSKLKVGQVRQIRLFAKAGVRKQTLAAQFGVDRSLVSMIVNRVRWREV